MELTVTLLCIVLSYVRADDGRFYKTDLAGIGDQRTEKTENQGFVEPIDFASFTQQFFHGGAQNFASLPFTNGGGFDFFGAESKDNQQLRLPAAGLLNFPKSPFAEDKQNSTGFVSPVNFVSAFDGQASPSSAIYRPEFYAPALRSTLPPVKPTVPENEDEERYIPPSAATIRASNRSPKVDLHRGKSNYPSPRPGYKSEHAPTASYADSEDVEIFYPPGKAILPQINGKPKPYDGYRAASDVETRVHGQKSPQYRSTSQRPFRLRRPEDERGAQQFSYGAEPAETNIHKKEVHQESKSLPDEEEEEEDEAEEEEEPKKKSSGYKYQYDSSVKVPDLIIKRYPYEKEEDNDEEFTHDYEKYTQSLPGDLEKHFGIPDYAEAHKYTVTATENLQNDKNCERIDSRGKREAEDVSKTCYICRNPKTGGSYEQCAYENEPTSNKYFYGGSTSSGSKHNPEPKRYRNRRSLDFFKPSSYEYFVYNDEPNLKRQARAETLFNSKTVNPVQPPKRKTKKFKYSSKKKNPKRKIRQPKKFESSSEIDGSPSYNGPRYTYEGPSQPYEGPSKPYEGPKYGYEGPASPYEGPKSDYEGPDHDDYYDRTDDRIPYKTNSPLVSSFYDDIKENKKRPRRGPKAEVEEFDPSEGYFADYRFGPSFFVEDEIEDKPEPTKRNVFQNQKHESPEKTDSEAFFTGNVKIFKNGDVCEKMKKDNMLCMSCNNDKTGAKYEQCQYSTKPNEKGYTYGSQKSFSSDKSANDRPQRHINADQDPEISDKVEKKYMMTKVESRKTFGEGEPLISEDSSRKYIVRKQRQTVEEESQDIGEAAEDEEEDGPKKTESSERIEARDGIEDLDEFLGEDKGSLESKFPNDHESYEDYFKRVFPEFEVYGKLTPGNFDPFSDLDSFKNDKDKSENINYEGSESVENPTRLKDQKSSLPPQFFANDDESKKDLANAFADFQKRDWSKCKKMIKDKLVCYSCLNANGIKNEECMYVEGSEPVTTHMAYHEKKEYDPAASNIQTQTSQEPKRNNTEPPPLLRKDKQTPEETRKEEYFVKGDFEGVERPRTETKTEENEKQIKKRKHPLKKYLRAEHVKEDSTWESTKVPKTDESVVKIYFNNTETTTVAA